MAQCSVSNQQKQKVISYQKKQKMVQSFKRELLLPSILFILHLCTAEKRGTPLFTTIANTDFHVATVIDVRLVGFQQNQGSDLIMSESRLLEVLNEAHRTQGTSNVHILRKSLSNQFNNVLHIQEKVLFQVSHVQDSTVLNSMEDMLRERVYTNEETSLPVSLTNDIVLHHFKQQPAYGAYVMYFLNPNVAPVRLLDSNGIPEGWRKPIYWYHKKQEANTATRNKCGFQSWVDTTERMVWMDISAGPCEYGPRTMGKGDVSEYTMLSGSNRWQTSNQWNDGQNEGDGDLAGQIANQIWVARQHLFLPPLLHTRTFKSTISSIGSTETTSTSNNIKQIFLYHLESDVALSTTIPTSTSSSSTQNWNAMKNAIQSIVLPGQTLQFQSERFPLKKHALCLSILLQIFMKSEGNKLLINENNLSTVFKPCFDSLKKRSKEFKQTNVHYPIYFIDARDIVGSIGKHLIHEIGSIANFGSRSFLTVGLENMSIVIRIKSTSNGNGASLSSSSSSSWSQFMCNGLLVPTTTNIQRITFATVLSGLYGVSPSQYRWDTFSNTVIEDWRWSISNTPFGPFVNDGAKNDVIPFSFVQLDAIHRNEIYYQIQFILQKLRLAVTNFTVKNKKKDKMKEVREVKVPYLDLTVNELHKLNELWNNFNVEFERIGSYTSILQFEHAIEKLNHLESLMQLFVDQMNKCASSFVPVRECV